MMKGWGGWAVWGGGSPHTDTDAGRGRDAEEKDREERDREERDREERDREERGREERDTRRQR